MSSYFWLFKKKIMTRRLPGLHFQGQRWKAHNKNWQNRNATIVCISFFDKMSKSSKSAEPFWQIMIFTITTPSALDGSEFGSTWWRHFWRKCTRRDHAGLHWSKLGNSWHKYFLREKKIGTADVEQVDNGIALCETFMWAFWIKKEDVMCEYFR